MEGNSVLGLYRKVAYVEQLHVLHHSCNIHEKDLLHAGYKKTFEKLYFYMVLKWIFSFRLCIKASQGVAVSPLSAIRKPQVISAPSKPIIANGFLRRLQVRGVCYYLASSPSPVFLSCGGEKQGQVYTGRVLARMR